MKRACALSLALLVGCASEIQREPTQLSAGPAPAGMAVLQIRDSVVAVPASGESAVLKGGSTWTYVGRIPQGSVYAIKNDVFNIKGRNSHEANCVVSGSGQLVGFYLPVEQAFVPAVQQVQLPINRK
jgi:hypothetical protein